MTNLRESFAAIHLGRLRSNIRVLKAHCGPEEFFCPMIKAQAYGHGAIEVGRILEAEGVRQVGLALIEEGIELRQAGLRSELLIFGTFGNREALAEIQRHCLTPVLSDWNQLELLRDATTGDFAFHLDFNTGMNRLGFDLQEAQRVAEFLANHPRLRCLGLMTHMHSSEDMNGAGAEQLRKFQQVLRHFPKNLAIHTLNSGGLIRRVQDPNAAWCAQGRGVRPGISLYGVVPFADASPIKVALHPIMRVQAKISAVRQVEVGASVSYGARWKATRPSRIGVVAFGYADGYPRHLSPGAQVLCRGKRLPIVGVVCMDYLMIDLTEMPQQGSVDQWLGEDVVLFGEPSLPVEEVATWAETIPYELLTRISERVPRVFIP